MTPGPMTRGTAGAASPALRAGERARPLAGLPRWLAALVATALLCLVCAIVADVPLARFTAQPSPQVMRVAALFSALGNSNYMLVGSGALAGGAYAICRRGRPFATRPVALLGERAAFVFGTVAVSGLLAQVVKHLVGRARPRLLDAVGAFHFDLFSMKASLASFPSGHTASAFGLALALSLMDRRLAPVLMVFAILVAAARVALGAHYLSDVVAGAALGSGVTLALALLCARHGVVFERRGRGLWLKGVGTVWPGLRALVDDRKSRA